jgi:hypothetical protein
MFPIYKIFKPEMFAVTFISADRLSLLLNGRDFDLELIPWDKLTDCRRLWGV